jgi:hypothetical protein
LDEISATGDVTTIDDVTSDDRGEECRTAIWSPFETFPGDLLAPGCNDKPMEETKWNKELFFHLKI